MTPAILLTPADSDRPLNASDEADLRAASEGRIVASRVGDIRVEIVTGEEPDWSEVD